MKKLIFTLSFIACVNFASAQISTGSLGDVSKAASSVSATDAMMVDNPEVQAKIEEQLMTNEGFQDQALDYLKSNPETTSALSSLSKSNSGIKSKIMKAVLDNPELTKSVMSWIKDNPEVLKKAMSLIGM